MTFKHCNRLSLPVLLTITLVLSAYAADSAAAKTYKWVDENGQVHYSSRLPAEQSKSDHQQLNEQGVVVGTKKKQVKKSEEEVAVEAEAKRKEDERLAEVARLKAIQDQKDRVLLMTFSNEEEINHARATRIDVIESVIELINKNIATTEQKLRELENTADRLYTSQGKDVPGGMAQKIEHFERKVENRRAQLAQKEAEKAKINEKYDIDLARYRVLRSSAN